MWMAHLYYAAWCLMPALAVAVGTKAWRAARLIERLHLPLHTTYLGIFWSDLGLWLALAGMGGLLLWLGQGRAPRLARIALHGLALATSLVATLDLVFYATTGDQLDWDLFHYAVRNLAMLWQVLGSETTPGKLLLLFAFPSMTLLPLLLRRGAPLGLPWRIRDALAVVAVALSLAVPLGPRALAHPVGLPPALQPLDHAIQWSWLQASVRDPTPPPSATVVGPPKWRWQAGKQDAKRRYNVLVVLLESTRASATSLEHPELVTTPRLATLAARGLWASQAYTTIPHTTKALIATLCGYPPRIDPEFSEAEWGALPAACLAELLGQQGYRSLFLTAAAGKFENNHQLVEQMGYQTVIMGDELADPSYAPQVAGHAQINYFGYEDAVLPGLLLGWTARQTEPFFATVLTLNAHHPYQLPGNRPRPNLAPGSLGDYLAAVQSTDAVLGEILDGLQKQGHGNDTLVLVLGDHGEAFGEHGQAQHDDVPYDEALRIPLVLAGPGVLAGQRAKGLRQNLDVAPTVLELLGISFESGARPGISLLSAQGHMRLDLAVWPRDRALIELSDARKLIDHLGRREAEVFDLAQDSSETRDIGAEVAQAEREAAHTRLLNWRNEVMQVWARQGLIGHAQVLPQLPATAQRLELALGCGLRLVAQELDNASQPPELKLYLRSVAPATAARRLELTAPVPGRPDEAVPPLAEPRPLPPPAWPMGASILQRYALSAPPRGPLRLRALQANGAACGGAQELKLPSH